MTARTAKGRQVKGRGFELWGLKALWSAVGRPWPWKHQRPDDGHGVPKEFQDYHVEFKRQERLNVWSACTQAMQEAHKTGKEHWVVVAKRNRERPVAIVDFYDWMSLVTTVRNGERGRLP